MAIIGVSGKARAGKDTFFSFAQKDGYIRLSFADALKARVRQDFGLTSEHTDGALKELPCSELSGHSPREFLIELGNIYRKYRSTYWVDVVVKKIQDNPQQNYMITDLRYPNEAEAIRKVGGFIVRLERHPDRDATVSDTTKQSISETALDNYDGFDVVLRGENNKVPSDLEMLWWMVKRRIGGAQ